MRPLQASTTVTQERKKIVSTKPLCHSYKGATKMSNRQQKNGAIMQAVFETTDQNEKVAPQNQRKCLENLTNLHIQFTLIDFNLKLEPKSIIFHCSVCV